MLVFVFFLDATKIRYDPNQKYEPISDQRLTAENETETKEAEEVLWPSVFFLQSLPCWIFQKRWNFPAIPGNHSMLNDLGTIRIITKKQKHLGKL